SGRTERGVLSKGRAPACPSEASVVYRENYNFSNNSRLSLRYNRLRPNQLNPRFPPTFRRDYFGINESGAASFIHSAPSWTGETRFGYNLIDVRRVQTLWLNGGAIPPVPLSTVANT